MSDDLKQLMVAYSRRGWRDWKEQAGTPLRNVATTCLANTIVEKDQEVEEVIDGERDGQRFIPMPKHGYSGFEWSFFLPKIVNGKLRSLTLFILVNRARRNCIAFRFESSPRGRHVYSHVQLTSRLEKSGLPDCVADRISGLPEWLPTKYPAFPVPAGNWIEMFLVMATAVHGCGAGIDVLLQEIFQEASYPDGAQRYKKVLDERLLNLDADP